MGLDPLHVWWLSGDGHCCFKVLMAHELGCYCFCFWGHQCGQLSWMPQGANCQRMPTSIHLLLQSLLCFVPGLEKEVGLKYWRHPGPPPPDYFFCPVPSPIQGVGRAESGSGIARGSSSHGGSFTVACGAPPVRSPSQQGNKMEPYCHEGPLRRESSLPCHGKAPFKTDCSAPL